MTIKRTNKTRAMAALMLSAAFLFAGCGNDVTKEVQVESDAVEEESSNIKVSVEKNEVEEIPSNKDMANDNDVMENQQEIPSKTYIYDSVLDQYIDMVQNDFYENLRGSDAYDSSFGEDIGLEIRTHKQDIYYAFYDVDGNGTMELLIAGGENGVSNPTFSPWNYDIYGYDGTNAVHIFPEMEFGYRTNFSLYENGVIEVFYSGSAAESGVDFYKIGDDGFAPELVDSFFAVAHLEGEEPVFTYSKNGNEITESEYNAGIQSYEVPLTTVLEWIQIQ